ncbi:MAG: DUF1553 domain-containing protein [Verrucomicrobia bacterium]|nr:DUF1553 domain-containing protein [Verrucomicrobiota bacterium]
MSWTSPNTRPTTSTPSTTLTTRRPTAVPSIASSCAHSHNPSSTTLDCADPSMQVGRRNESVSPLQSLALLNNALVLTLSQHFAARLDLDDGDLLAKVRRAHTEALGRPPTASEEQALTRYAAQFGLTNLCRVLFNLNEFSFVD